MQHAKLYSELFPWRIAAPLPMVLISQEHAKKSLREILRSEISASKTQIDNVSKIRLDNIEDWSK